METGCGRQRLNYHDFSGRREIFYKRMPISRGGVLDLDDPPLVVSSMKQKDRDVIRSVILEGPREHALICSVLLGDSTIVATVAI